MFYFKLLRSVLLFPRCVHSCRRHHLSFCSAQEHHYSSGRPMHRLEIPSLPLQTFCALMLTVKLKLFFEMHRVQDETSDFFFIFFPCTSFLLYVHHLDEISASRFQMIENDVHEYQWCCLCLVCVCLNALSLFCMSGSHKDFETTRFVAHV